MADFPGGGEAGFGGYVGGLEQGRGRVSLCLLFGMGGKGRRTIVWMLKGSVGMR